MSHELMYTSAPKGLFAGARGFCTVTSTRGLPHPFIEKLEAISGYRPLFPPLDARAGQNPIAHSHLRVTVSGRSYSVVSRIGPAGLDYSDRTNLFAHHVVLEAEEFPRGGPAWLLRQPGFLTAAWDGEVKVLPTGRLVPKGDLPLSPCRAWQQASGDAGWAGVIAETFVNDPGRLVYLLFDPGFDPLPLLGEALSVLPPELRWDVTFTTYYTGLPQGLNCAWRCVPRGSAEAAQASRLPGALILNLSTPLGAAHGGALVETARTGRAAVAVAPREQSWGEQSEPDAFAGIAPLPRHFRPTSGQDLAMPDSWIASAPKTSGPARPAAQPPPMPAVAAAQPRRTSPWLLGIVLGTGAGILLASIVFALLMFALGPAGTRPAPTTTQAATARDDAKPDRVQEIAVTKTGDKGSSAGVRREDLDKLKEENERLRNRAGELEKQLGAAQDKLWRNVFRGRHESSELRQELQLLTQARADWEREREELRQSIRELKEKLEREKPPGLSPPKTVVSQAPTPVPSVTLPALNETTSMFWELSKYGLDPSKKYVLLLDPMPVEERGVRLSSSPPKLPMLSILSHKDGTSPALAYFKIHEGRLEFRWREDADEASANLLRLCKLKIIEQPGGTETIFKLKLP